NCIRGAVEDVTERAVAFALENPAVLHARLIGTPLILLIVITQAGFIVQPGRAFAAVSRSRVRGTDQRCQVFLPEFADKRAMRRIGLVYSPRCGEARCAIRAGGNALIERPLLDHRQDRDDPTVIRAALTSAECRELRVGVVIVVHGQAQLLEVVLALGATRRL